MRKQTLRKQGLPISDGLGEGKIWFVSAHIAPAALPSKIPAAERENEEAKLRHAIQLVSFFIENAMNQIRVRAGEEHARIFGVLKQILHDKTLLDQMVSLIRQERDGAYEAVKKTYAKMKQMLQASPLPRTREQVADLAEIEQELLDALLNPLSLVEDSATESHDKRYRRVVVSPHLTPRLVLEMRGRRLKGIISESGGVTSHGAILCRALGIPAVSGVAGIIDERHRNSFVAMNGFTGEVLITNRTQECRRFLQQSAHTPRTYTGRDLLPGTIEIYANVNIAEQAERALTAGARGIGLYRSELEFLAAGHILTEKEQLSKYRQLILTMMGAPVFVRILDVTEDKFGPLLGPDTTIFQRTNAGPDFLLNHPSLIRNQARAIAKAAMLGPVHVLYPRIENLRQFVRLKQIFREAVADIGDNGIRHGVMFELPQACTHADEILAVADFGTLGTNDLVQQLFAVDRERASSTTDELNQRPEVWQLIKKVAQAAQAHGRPLSVCGEMASVPHYIQRFTELGIHAFSVDIAKIKELKKAAGIGATD